MKQLLTFLFISLFTLTNAYSQKKRVYLDRSQRLSSPENAYMYEEWQETKQGNIVGSFKEFYISGKLKKEIAYSNSGIKDGKYISYYENGQIKEKGNYQKGNKTGLWKQWHLNGQIASSGKHEGWKKVGPWKLWYDNGQLKDSTHYTDGKAIGASKKWHQNGNLLSSGNYSKDKKEGIWKYWHDNGKLQMKGLYKEGVKNDIWEFWYDHGQMSSKGSYLIIEDNDPYIIGKQKNAVKDGEWQHWHPNGQKAILLHYKTGKLNRIGYEWHPNGQKATEYDFDKKVLLNGWDLEGKQTVIDGTGSMKHYQNSVLVSFGNYKNGLKIGKWTYYLEGNRQNEVNKVHDNSEITSLEQKTPTTDDQRVFKIVEKNAEPKQGMGAFYKYVSKECKYPKYAKKKGIEGRIFINFIVNKDGTLSNFRALRQITFCLEREALRVMRNAPNWNPATQRGKPVRVNMTIPLLFKL